MWTTSHLRVTLLELTCCSRIRWQNQINTKAEVQCQIKSERDLQEPSRSAGMLSVHVMTNVPPLARSYQDGGCRLSERVGTPRWASIFILNNSYQGCAQSIPVPRPHPCFRPACLSLEVQIIVLGQSKSSWWGTRGGGGLNINLSWSWQWILSAKWSSAF